MWEEAGMRAIPPSEGSSAPLGATPSPAGVNFSVFSRHATGVELLLFDGVDEPRPAHVVPIDPATQRTYHYWHAFVPGVKPGQLYGYRVAGPFDPGRGLRFDPAKVLLDPYGRGVVVPEAYSRDAAGWAGDNAATAMKSVVVDPSAYDWEGDRPLKRPAARTIVYEMHVRGFTRHPSSGVGEKTRGTYAGLIEKIPYLQQLGITAVEFLPVFQFDALACPPGHTPWWSCWQRGPNDRRASSSGGGPHPGGCRGGRGARQRDEETPGHGALGRGRDRPGPAQEREKGDEVETVLLPIGLTPKDPRVVRGLPVSGTWLHGTHHGASHRRLQPPWRVCVPI